MTIYINGQATSLTQRDYVSEGGEGKVYSKGDIGYKIYHDPKKMLPLGKIKELQQIQNPNIIRPLDIICDAKGTAIGYTMRFIKEAWTLCQLFPKPFRDRNGVTHAMMLKMVQDLQKLFEDVHSAGILIVDANEMNFLVTKDFNVVLAIDADSYQTPHYAATAIMLSVRDWTVHHNRWTEASDWFSFACVSFQMFTSLHPYKGKHPTVNGMEERMKAGISVFDPQVQVPPVTYDFRVIPLPYLEWYKRVFVAGARQAPPSHSGTAPALPAPVKPVTGRGLVKVTEYGSYDSDITGFWVHGTKLVVQTQKLMWVDKRQVGASSTHTYGCAFTKTGVPVEAEDFASCLMLSDLQNQKPLAPNYRVNECVSGDGRLYMRVNEHVQELVFTEAGGKVLVSAKIVANVMPNSTRLYSGVVVQSMLGSCFVSLLARSGAAYQVRMPELDKYRIMEAKFEKGVLMVVGEHKGKYDRLVCRFDADFTVYDLRTVSDIQPSGLNFTVLDTGVCACIDEDGQLELFKCAKDAKGLKLINDPIIPGDAMLGSVGGTVIFAHGPKLYSLKTV